MTASLAAVFLMAGCGKKAPPLAPLTNLPRQVADLTARRLGPDVYLRFTIPRANADGRQPADIERVDVYGLTATQVTGDEIVKYGTLIAQVPVREPPPPPPIVEEGEPPPPPPPPTGPGLDQGAIALVMDTLTPDRLIPVVTKAEEERIEKQSKLPAPPPGPLVGPPPLQGIGRRWYTTVGINHRGRKGLPSNRAPVLLGDLPPAPAAPTVSFTAQSYNVTWTIPPGARESIQEQAPETPASQRGAGLAQPGADAGGARPVPPSGVPTEGEPPPIESQPKDETPSDADAARLAQPPDQTPTLRPAESSQAPLAGSPPAGPPAVRQVEGPATATGELPIEPGPPPILTGRPGALVQPFPASTYNVYDVAPLPMPAPSVSKDETVLPINPTPLNGQPISGVTFQDRRMVFGAERCYAIRTVNIFGPVRIESEPSPTTCVTAADTFPPAAPRGLAAVGTQGVISLIWEANSEADLDGYVVLRGDEGSEALRALTPRPIKDTTYRDTSARPGVRYTYAVVAVDRARPPNVSQQSNRVVEAAR